MQHLNTQDQELNSILYSAQQASYIVCNALQQEYDFHQKMFQDQNALLAQNAMWSTNHTPAEIAALQAQTLTRIEKDLHYVQTLNQHIAAYPEQENLTYSLRTNKMENILLGAQVLIGDYDFFVDVIQGHLPVGYNNFTDSPVLLGQPQSFYGNSKSSYFSAALLEAHLTLTDTAHIQDIKYTLSENWIDQAAIAHLTPMPATLVAELGDGTDTFSFYYSDVLTEHGLAFLHSGYAFGGQRDEPRYHENKTFGPEDCSSWISKITGSEVAFSTIDQLFTFRMGLPEETRGYIDPDWLQSDYAKVIDVLSPVIIEDPFTDIHAGQVFAFRQFNSEEHLSSAGTSGHTELVLGVRENGNVITIGYGRSMPEKEGFGISEYSWKSTDKREVMFFDVKKPSLTIEDILLKEDCLFEDAENHTAIMPSPVEPLCYATLWNPMPDEQPQVVLA